MKRSTFLLLGLLVVLMAIVYLIKRPMQVEESTYTLPDVKVSFNPAMVGKIEIERGKKYIRLEKLKGSWKITDPIRNAVDEVAMNRLLEGLAGFRITGLVSTNPDKQSIFEVSEQGTNVIVTNDDGTSTALVIGKGDPSTNLTFVRLASSGSVYVAQGITSTLVNHELREWRQRTVYRVDPGLLQAIVLRQGEEQLTIRRRGERWYGEDRVVPANLMNSFLAAITNVRAEDFVDTALILNSPPEIHVELVGKETFSIDFYPHEGNPQQYFAKASSTPVLFTVGRTLPAEAIRVNEYLLPEPEIVEEAAPPAEVKKEPPPTVIKELKPEPRATEQKERRVVIEPPQNIQTSPPQTTPSTTQSGSSAQSGGKGADDEGELIVHTVQRGESMEAVAQKYGVTMDDIKRWNSLKSAALKPGKELYIYVAKK